MSIHRLLVVARKEFCHITRDLRLLFLVTVAPSFLLVTLSYVFALDVGRVDLAVHDLDQTTLSRDLVSHITADGDFAVVTWLEDVREVERLFTRRVADIVLVIPRGFARTVLQGEPAQIQCIVDGVDAIGASQSLGLLESRVQASVARAARSRAGRGAGSLGGRSDPVATQGLAIKERAWYNKALKSLISMVPGLMAVILCMPALAFALALAREKEMGSFESLIVTPVRGVEYLIGKLLAYEAGGVASGILALMVATLWFRVPFRGSIPAFLLLTADYMIASTGISLVVASLVRNQQTAMFLILMIFFVPSFFLAGLLRPVAEEPIARAVAYLLPSTHFIKISRGLFLKGLSLSALRAPGLALLGIGLACQLISLLLFDKKLT
jgi:ABC-2 type transport system permease protein